MIILIIIYLIGVLINCYILSRTPIKEYNTSKMITLGTFLGYTIVCLTSWVYTIIALIVGLCYWLYTFFNKPLIKKK